MRHQHACKTPATSPACPNQQKYIKGISSSSHLPPHACIHYHTHENAYGMAMETGGRLLCIILWLTTPALPPSGRTSGFHHASQPLPMKNSDGGGQEGEQGREKGSGNRDPPKPHLLLLPLWPCLAEIFSNITLLMTCHTHRPHLSSLTAARKEGEEGRTPCFFTLYRLEEEDRRQEGRGA